MLGKRKRREEVPVRRKKLVEWVEERSNNSEDSEAESGEGLDAQEVFRRHFEAQFKPLPEPVKIEQSETQETDEEEVLDDGSDWEGLSENEDDSSIQVIEHVASAKTGIMSKEELKCFMSSKPPHEPSSSSIDSLFSRIPASSKTGDTDPTEANNLANDLALQRLLTESHLLDSTASAAPTGANHHKATDLRLLSLGAKTSILAQKNMPMNIRRGISAKKESKAEERRRDAKENGIILEVMKKGKGKAASAGDAGKRERGIGAPGVGRFKGGTLTLSKKDVREIEGPKRAARGGRGGGRGAGRGGGRGRGKKR